MRSIGLRVYVRSIGLGVYVGSIGLGVGGRSVDCDHEDSADDGEKLSIKHHGVC